MLANGGDPGVGGGAGVGVAGVGVGDDGVGTDGVGAGGGVGEPESTPATASLLLVLVPSSLDHKLHLFSFFVPSVSNTQSTHLEFFAHDAQQSSWLLFFVAEMIVPPL